MAIADDIRASSKSIFKENWTTRKGIIVPEPESIKLSNDAVEFERATILYADLSGSTNMVDSSSWTFAAEIYKSFLFAAAKVIRFQGGTITSYDGDRVMGIFIGDGQCTSAAKAGLQINYAVQKIINPELKTAYPSSAYAIKHVVGIDMSEIRAARTGVRGGNDIVWVGKAANHAAKMTAINNDSVQTWIGAGAYSRLADEAKIAQSSKANMWKSYSWNGGTIYGSGWTWAV